MLRGDPYPDDGLEEHEVVASEVGDGGGDSLRRGNALGVRRHALDRKRIVHADDRGVRHRMRREERAVGEAGRALAVRDELREADAERVRRRLHREEPLPVGFCDWQPCKWKTLSERGRLGGRCGGILGSLVSEMRAAHSKSAALFALISAFEFVARRSRPASKSSTCDTEGE